MTVMVVDKTVVGIGGRLLVAVGGGHEVGGVEHLDANFQSQKSNPMKIYPKIKTSN